jgi:hypothetical protein
MIIVKANIFIGYHKVAVTAHILKKALIELILNKTIEFSK